MKLLAHIVTFHGKPGGKVAPGVNYKSNDLRVIATQLELMQRLGYDGVIALSYADVDPFMDDACQKILFMCEQKQMLFGLCMDPWSMGKAKATMTVEQKNARWAQVLAWAASYLDSPAYLPEQYVIDFATGADLPTVRTQNPGYNVLGVYHEVAWPKVSVGLDSKANMIQQNATAIIPGIMHSFDDHDPANPAVGIWDASKPPKRIDGQDGILEVEVTKALAGRDGYVQDITWNDNFERTHRERRAICWALQQGIDVSALL